MVVNVPQMPSDVPQKVQQEGSRRDSPQAGWHIAWMSAAHCGILQPREDRDDGVATLTNPAHNLGTRHVMLTELPITIPDVSRRAQPATDEVHQRARCV